ncbi:MAG: DUF1573 domain-containing protein, partial [Muribaculaceae bacterium]|nr:DUF1573 domain-containing protein [Muribaculaceae bacterium]
MKLLAAIFAFTLSFSATAQSSVTWLETAHNFGAFSENDGKVACTFRFVNNRQTPVIIQSARATCGCTTPKYPTAPIAPGDTAEIQVSYNAIGRPGKFSKKVYIYSNTTP